MAEDLTIFSTIEDLRSCSREVLISSIDAVGREVVLAYILELREEKLEAQRTAELGPPIICRAPPPLPELPLALIEDPEETAKGSKSLEGTVKFTARFTNNTGGNIDLIWKDYNGGEVLVRQDIRPGVTHGECTFMTHPFLARDSETRKLRRFSYQSHSSVVFEGGSFGVKPRSDVKVSVFGDEEAESGPGPSVPISGNDIHTLAYQDAEEQAARSRTPLSDVKYNVKFNNCTSGYVELIWKDTEGEEISIAMIRPASIYKHTAYYSQPYITRDKYTRKLGLFKYGDNLSVVFEGHDFGVVPQRGSGVTVEILPRPEACFPEGAFSVSEEEGERQAARSKSSRNQLEFTVEFINRTSIPVDLLWKDFDGKEVIKVAGLQPEAAHVEETYFTHPFIVREADARKLRYFHTRKLRSFIFEGLNFGVSARDSVTVEIN